ncbi:alpha carbonic anhydrase [Pavlovales sp. CCMP2436]|nr:alpha carbonic anhydrase [Pavlovales sp. CCMP2436]
MCGEYAEPGVGGGGACMSATAAPSRHLAARVAAALALSPVNIHALTTVPIDAEDLSLQMYYEDIIPPYSRDSHVMAKGQCFNLIQFHLHSPSEHQFDGNVYPTELHFAHQNPVISQLLVFGLLFGHDGNNSAIFLDELASPTSIAKGELDFALGSLPEVRAIQNWSYYHYMGSLTADRCADDVIWAVSSYIAPSNEMVVSNHVGLSGIFSTAQPFQLLNGTASLSIRSSTLNFVCFGFTAVGAEAMDQQTVKQETLDVGTVAHNKGEEAREPGSAVAPRVMAPAGASVL